KIMENISVSAETSYSLKRLFSCQIPHEEAFSDYRRASSDVPRVLGDSKDTQNSEERRASEHGVRRCRNAPSHSENRTARQSALLLRRRRRDAPKSGVQGI